VRNDSGTHAAQYQRTAKGHPLALLCAEILFRVSLDQQVDQNTLAFAFV